MQEVNQPPFEGATVEVTGNRFKVGAKDTNRGRSTYGWYECVQETGHPAVVGSIQYLSESMLRTGQRHAPKLY